MDCCSHSRGLNDLFDERTAQDELRQSLAAHGIDRHARRIVDALAARGVADASVLEIGGGIGGLHAELLRRGASRATDVDIASAYIAAAQSLAERLGLRERVEYRQADFASVAGDLAPADIVVMNRVVCCYPDMPALITAAAQHAGRLLAVSFPITPGICSWPGACSTPACGCSAPAIASMFTTRRRSGAWQPPPACGPCRRSPRGPGGSRCSSGRLTTDD